MIHTITKHLAALAVALLPASGMATDFTVDGIWYDITSTSIVEVAGARRDAGSGGRIVIPSTVEYRGQTYRVTAIGNKAFENDTYVTSVSIPGSVTTIGDYGFRNCDSLTTVTMSEGLTSIGDYGFQSCGSLTAIDIPDGVTTLGDYCFDNCHALTSLSIPGSVASFGYYCF